MNSEGFRETLSEERQRRTQKAKMAGKKEAKQKAGPRGRTEKKLKVPREQRTPQRREGREQPKACSERRRRERKRKRTLKVKGNP